MTKRKIGHNYWISDDFWNKIKLLLPFPKPKKKLEDLEKINV
jgi:putative transposase